MMLKGLGDVELCGCGLIKQNMRGCGQQKHPPSRGLVSKGPLKHVIACIYGPSAVLGVLCARAEVKVMTTTTTFSKKNPVDP